MEENEQFEDENVFNRFEDKQYDTHVEFNHNFIPRQHQIIPKYYLLTGKVNSIVLHYSLGSGKTAAAVFAVLQHIMSNVNENFLGQFLKNRHELRKICVIGSWQTQAQFETELMRPEFNLIPDAVLHELNKMLNSDDKNIHDEGVKKRERIRAELSKYVSYYGYQKFFKLIFSFQSGKSVQNYNLLIEEFKHNRLSVSQKFLDEFSNSIIIIDEMQKLYSFEGLNTYGLAAVMLNSALKDYNIKVIYLTGTMFNTSVTEIESISALFSNRIKYDIDESKFINIELINGIKGQRINPDVEDDYIKLLGSHFAYYEQNNFREHNEQVKILGIPQTQPQYDAAYNKPVNTETGVLCNNVYIPEILKKEGGDDLRCMVLPYVKHLPSVLYVGNEVINDETCEQPFMVFTLRLQGHQNETYTKCIASHKITNVKDILGKEEVEENVEDKEHENFDKDDDDDDESFRKFDESRFGIVTEQTNETNSLLDFNKLQTSVNS